MQISAMDDCVWLNPDCSIMVHCDTPEQSEKAAMRINNYDRLVSEREVLKTALRSLVVNSENNTGHEPSLSCMYRAIDEAKALLAILEWEE